MWWKAECDSRSNPKFAAAGPSASWLWFCANCYAREQLTDGFIPRQMLSALVPGMTFRQALVAAKRLVEAKLFIEIENGGYIINDFLDYHPSKADVAAGREWDNRRKALYADKELVAAIRLRDEDHCRYCDVEVHWKDRRGPTGGQFDHVIPRGDNSYTNVVVSCRQCNAKKNDRTPEQAGMQLLSPRGFNDKGFRTSSGFSSEVNTNLFPSYSDSSISVVREEKKQHPVKDLLSIHERLFLEKYGEKPAKYAAKDAKHAKDLIDQRGIEKASELIKQAFASRDTFIANSGHSMGVIVSSSVQNRLIAELSVRGKTAQPQQQSSSLRVIDEMEAKRHAG